MINTRRGFLKTLGKLAVAVGITTAACSAHHHGHHRPHHPPKAKPCTTRKATNRPDYRHFNAGFTGFKKCEETTPLSYETLEKTYNDAVNEPVRFASNVCVVNRPVNVESAVEATSRHQEWLNRLTIARIDNISQTLNPHILLKDLIG